MIDMPGGDIIAPIPAKPEPRDGRQMFDGKWWTPALGSQSRAEFIARKIAKACLWAKTEEVIIAARAAEEAVHELDSMNWPRKPTASTDKVVADVTIQQRWDSNAMRDLSDLRKWSADLVTALVHARPWIESGPRGSWRDGVLAEIDAALLQAGAAPCDGGER